MVSAHARIIGELDGEARNAVIIFSGNDLSSFKCKACLDLALQVLRGKNEKS